MCALVMLANGVAWSFIVPPFEVPDENAHYAYVQQVAERGTVPRAVQPEGLLSPAEDAMLGAVFFYRMIGEKENPAPTSVLQQHAVEATERQRLSTRGSGDALTATNNPPLYYVLEAVPYKLASGGGVLARLMAMRLLSALMGAVTVLLIYLFLSELLPGRRWAWATGALVAAFQPLFSFMSGGVNNDNLLYLTAAGLLGRSRGPFEAGSPRKRRADRRLRWSRHRHEADHARNGPGSRPRGADRAAPCLVEQSRSGAARWGLGGRSLRPAGDRLLGA